MKTWATDLHKDVLIVTYNKTNAEVLNEELKQAGVYCEYGVDARTLDSLCAKVCNEAYGRKVLSTDLDYDLALCKAYFPKDAMKRQHISGKCASDIVKFRLRHPRAKDWHMCDRHRGFTQNPKQRWGAEIDSYPIKDIADKRDTYAAKRYACDADGRMLGDYVDRTYDVVVVDETQDLTCAQELRLLFQTACPVVMVGDLMQAVNAYLDDPPCPNCTLTQDVDAPTLPPPIEWYGTWQLDPFTVRFIEERFGKRMYSYRQLNVDADTVDSDAVEVHWRPELVHKDGTLVMCRANRRVAEIAETHDGMRVVKGDNLAKKLEAASKDKSGLHPNAAWAKELIQHNKLSSTIALLKERSVTLNELKNSATMSVVSTVHQVKGFERDHCAVHEDLLIEPNNECERAIRFVAFTRHKRSLVVMRAV